jgi:hypothetical protein
VIVPAILPPSYFNQLVGAGATTSQKGFTPIEIMVVSSSWEFFGRAGQ